MEQRDSDCCNWRGSGWLATPPFQAAIGDAMIWAIIIITGLFTFVMRFVMLSGIAPRKLPTIFEDARSFVPIAVLTAILVPAVLTGKDNNIMLLDNAQLPAAFVAVVVALISRSIVITIIIGLSALWLLKFMGFP